MKSLFLILLGFSFFINDLPINEAKLLIAQKKYQAALQVLSNDITVEANFYRGLCYFHLGNCSAASLSFNTFIQSENKYQSESWKSEARIFLNKCQNKTTNSDIAQNQPKKVSKIDNLKAQYQKSFIEINNALNQQNRYEDSIKFVEANGLNIENKNLKSFIIKANDISSGDNLLNKSVIEEIKPSEKIITPKSDPKQEVAPPINTTPIPDIANKTKTNQDTPKPDPKQEAAPTTNTKPFADIATKSNQNQDSPTPDVSQKASPAIKSNPIPDIKTKTTPKPVEKIEITVSEKKHHYKILFTIDNRPDKTFMSLANIGPVTYEKANGDNYLYYIGFFQSEEKAIEAREKVKAAGYKMSRVLEFNQGALEKELKEEKEQPAIAEVLDKKTTTEAIPVEITKPPKAVEPKQTEKPKEQIQEVIKSDVVSYHILFRVLNNPYEKFDDLKQFGPLYRETFDTNGSSRYLIGNTASLEEAKSLLEKVKKAGYGASMVAEYVNGQLSKIVTE